MLLFSMNSYSQIQILLHRKFICNKSNSEGVAHKEACKAKTDQRDQNPQICESQAYCRL